MCNINRIYFFNDENNCNQGEIFNKPEPSKNSMNLLDRRKSGSVYFLRKYLRRNINRVILFAIIAFIQQKYINIQ